MKNNIVGYFQYRRRDLNTAGINGRRMCLVILLFLNSGVSFAWSGQPVIAETKQKNGFTLSTSGFTAPLSADSKDFPGVIRVLRHLQNDIKNVTGVKPILTLDAVPPAQHIVIAGTLGKNTWIDSLVNAKKLDVREIAGKREAYLIQIVQNPFPGIAKALVITGSDKRGTIYGLYSLSESIGVSPWYWWADVPIKKKQSIFIKPGRYTEGEPKVLYRGIFINDEAPALSGFVQEKFGGFTSAFYEHVFELILRLKGNYLWPAMWNNSFNTDDTLNPKLADEYGIVMGTSHHEPMMRAWKEWEREGNGSGTWDYSKNAEALRAFWKEGIRRTKDYESIVTLAMRGDGDEPMSEGANINLLQTIVQDQRKILAETTGKDIVNIPQVWALYKEVQEYYDKGMRVPDDVTVLLCDDNWGNIRKLAKPTDPVHSGGYGIYYHFDFVGGPRNYKWLNTTQIERVWEQMHLAYEYGARKIWIVNVGDIKPMEFPIDFFLHYAWNPEQFDAKDLPEFSRQWAETQFGKKYAQDIAHLLNAYTKFNSRCKPELLSPETFSLTQFREAESAATEYAALAEKAKRIHALLPPEYNDAFYQLVLHPITACANLYELYLTIGKNRMYARHGRAATNTLAKKAKELFQADSLISYYYNRVLAGGKWSHVMDQTHIGYTSWQEPKLNHMPHVDEIQIPENPEMGVAVEGSKEWWPYQKTKAVLPEYDMYHQQTYYIEIFNRGKKPFEYSIHPEHSWVMVSSPHGTINMEKRIFISVDWAKAPRGVFCVPITVASSGKESVIVQAVIHNPAVPSRDEITGFVESNGTVSFNAENYTHAKQTKEIRWVQIPNLGRTGSAMTAMPVTAPSCAPEGSNPRLEYSVYLFSQGEISVQAYFSPTLDFHGKGLRYALSFDEEPPVIIDIHKNDTIPDWLYPNWWNQSVSENIKIAISRHMIQRPGTHVLKFWMVDPGVVLQKIVINTGMARQSYLGPPQSYNRKEKGSKESK